MRIAGIKTQGVDDEGFFNCCLKLKIPSEFSELQDVAETLYVASLKTLHQAFARKHLPGSFHSLLWPFCQHLILDKIVCVSVRVPACVCAYMCVCVCVRFVYSLCGNVSSQYCCHGKLNGKQSILQEASEVACLHCTCRYAGSSHVFDS